MSDLSSPRQGVDNPALTLVIPPRRGRSRNTGSPSPNTNISCNNNQKLTTAVASHSFEANCSPLVLEENLSNARSPSSYLPSERSGSFHTQQLMLSRPKDACNKNVIPPAKLSLPLHDRLAGIDTPPAEDRAPTAEGNWLDKHDGHRDTHRNTMGAQGSSVILSDSSQEGDPANEPCNLVTVTRGHVGRKTVEVKPRFQDSQLSPGESPRSRPTTPGSMKTSQTKHSVKAILLQDRSTSSSTTVYPESVVADASGDRSWVEYPSAVAADASECGDPKFSLCPLNTAVNNSSTTTARNKSLFWNSQVSTSSMERRRRNFSSSSLPLSLMTTHTIEEVDDTEESLSGTRNEENHAQRGLPGDRVQQQQNQQQQQQRSNSYGGSIAPRTPRIPLRVLRREARVPSMGSPPRYHLPSCTSASCPACCDTSPGSRGAADSSNITGIINTPNSNNTSPCDSGPPSEADTTLSDVDIVGESFTSRYPWQRDVGIQCFMSQDSGLKSFSSSDYKLQYSHQCRLQRATSGPTYFRSLSASSSNTCYSPCSSPPVVPGTPGRPAALQSRPHLYTQRHNGNNSCSQPHLNAANLSPSDPSCPPQTSPGSTHGMQPQEMISGPLSSAPPYSYKTDSSSGYHSSQQFQQSMQSPQHPQPRHKPPLYRSQTACSVPPGSATGVPQDLVNTADSSGPGSPYSGPGSPYSGPGSPYSGPGSPYSGPGSPYSVRRANFKRRPRPSSMGAVENIR